MRTSDFSKAKKGGKSKHVIHSNKKQSLSSQSCLDSVLTIPEYFEPTHLDELFQLVRYLQAQIIREDGEFLEGVTTRDLSSLIGAISALLRSFASYGEKLDDAAETSYLRYCVTESLLKMPRQVQKEFLSLMDEFPEYEERRRKSHLFWRQRVGELS